MLGNVFEAPEEEGFKMNIYVKNIAVALVVFFFCVLSTSNLASALWTSTQLGGYLGIFGNTPEGIEERARCAFVAQTIANYSQFVKAATYNWFGSQTTTDAIYSAASGVNGSLAYNSIAFYSGEGYWTSEYHFPWYWDKQYCIYDYSGNMVLDHNIGSHSANLVVNFVFLWSCFQGEEIGGNYGSGYAYGMPYCWLNSASLSTNGYVSPDGNGRTFIGWTGGAPWLTHVWSEGDLTNFINNFYFAALCDGWDCSVNVALDYASKKTFGKQDFSYTDLYNGWNGTTGYSNMTVYGDGNNHLSNAGPWDAMKTGTNGYFYCPNLWYIDTLKIENTFDDTNLTGDQYGGSPLPYYHELLYQPDGTVNMKDTSFLVSKFNSHEGDSPWVYMADVVPDKVINMKDVAVTIAHFNHHGTYSADLSGVQVTFCGNFGQPVVITPDINGFVQIPSGALNFTVTRNNAPTGAWVLLWFTA